jgi:molybdopterin-guanine dinucleotide biosynthesis protein A
MRHAGFVLVGGKSSRMGRDKALLAWNGTTLAQNAARIVKEACGNVALVGDPARYGSLGLRVFADRFPGCGPIGGVVTALTVSSPEWCLVVGCDMPALSPEALRLLLAETARTDAESIIPLGEGGPEPLCAVYHRACLPALEKAISEGRFRMRDIVNELRPRFLAGLDPASFANLNTPEDLEAFSHSGENRAQRGAARPGFRFPDQPPPRPVRS